MTYINAIRPPCGLRGQARGIPENAYSRDCVITQRGLKSATVSIQDPC